MSMHLNPTAVVAHRDDEIDLSEVTSVLIENRTLIAAITATVLALGVGYAFLGTPVYRADATVQVDDDTGALNDKLGDLAQIFSGKGTADAEIELIRSRSVVDDTVRQLHLDIDAQPRYFPLIGRAIARTAADGTLAEPVWGLGRFAWGGETLRVSQFDVPPTLYTKRFTLIAGTNEHFELRSATGETVLNGRVGEVATGMTGDGPVSLRVDSVIARSGTEFRLSRTSTQLTTVQLQKTLDVAEKTKQSGVIGIRLDGDDSARTTATVNAIVRAYVQRNVGWKSARAQQMLGFLGDRLPQLRADLEHAEQRYNTFRNRNGTIDLDAESRLLLQGAADANAQVLALQRQRSELLQRFTPTHPSVTALEAQLADLRRRQNVLDAKIAALPNTQQAAVRLLREVDINSGLYTNLMDSAQQLGVLKAGQLGNVRVVDYAVTAEQPVKPRKALVIAAAGALGLMLGAAAAFVRRALRNGLDSPLEIEEIARAPVYAVISHSERQMRLQRAASRGEQGAHILAVSAPDDIAVEGVRSLRTALQFRLAEAPNNVVMITGPRPHVGKSFLSANLAVVLASVGKRVLIVDGDMRRGELHRYFGLSRERGLPDMIAGAELDAVLHRQVLPGLDVLTRGRGSPMPAEMLYGERLGTLLEQFAQAYDIVILDTPPVLAVTDSALIGKHAGTTLLVMRHARHSAAELRETTRLLGAAGVSIDGVVLGDVPLRASDYAYSPYHSTPDTAA
ncbi:polysaccharide biosynthesis tyrosine autokinase [Paraburkholderia sp. D15]|uniref:polysaccharide biosynthesis tyrosine autokinase n=1 Tax=Paraburkholderia sp. D15 TaxID=2880218 RepID=UPI00247A2C2D|nr:polysaccharide biosynthesis tyrosine autokinase [Paraburkholderia sp. D15]WGS53980.1 polysaccharide biosynthesis tyrosine autokinase [Paraburkholderia sp. D15]